MRIVYMSDVFPKVSETFVRDEVQWVARQGWLVGFYTLNRDGSLLDTLEHALRGCVHQISKHKMTRRLRTGYGLYWLLRAPRRFASIYLEKRRCKATRAIFWRAVRLATKFKVGDVDVIHVHFAGRTAQVAHVVSRLTGIEFTVTAHRYDIFSEPPPNYLVLARNALSLITISEYNKQYMIERLGLPANRIQVVHCGVDLLRFRGVPAIARAGRRYRFVNVARLSPEKGHVHLLDACVQLKHWALAFELVLIGDGEMAQKLQGRVIELGLDDVVTWLGAQPSERVLAELQNADAFVLPSLSEGIPVVLMEAMAVELPVIATRTHGVPELVQDGRNGRLVPSGQMQPLAEAMGDLIAAPDAAAVMGRDGRRTVFAKFNAPVQYARLAEIWRQWCLGTQRNADCRKSG